MTIFTTQILNKLDINQYLDSTYLKTPIQAGISKEETHKNVIQLVQEAITENFKLVMIRPRFVSLAKELVTKANSNVLVGTVIGFHEGTLSTEDKLIEAKQAIDDGADELDFVINYPAFLNGNINLIKSEVFKGSKLGLEHGKIVKWIIEIAALSNDEIIAIAQLIKDVVLSNFGDKSADKIFVKSSTGFYKTSDNKPSGATFEAMKLIIENAKPLQVKAAGGVKNYEDAIKMINLGVNRIGTSSAKAIADGQEVKNDY
ncbi:deoxyribose-phosphate aldolase [Aureibaculum sp. 2210JD6-5]|uniref:deoxyribose-phosphate aldolase n=1 Tax=Aureibaculum sp. 2210JD6-5 TaxID=3103957 RepID=UPI002AAC8418|nr:deoxyribose-phosphate aldolase [Aureibaculum sp. 2210JD6-5]MDY7394589.1 deoxyribose-phosphate aldolase [Aureibaculum sp. 2210JD6-5]